MLGCRSRENLPLADRGHFWQRLSIALLFYLPSQLTTAIQMSSSIPRLSVTEAARGADERKSLKSLNRPVGILLRNICLIIILLWWTYRRHCVVGVNMIIDLVCWVWLKLLWVGLCTNCVCGVLVCTDVFNSRVVYKYYTHILCFSLSTKSTSWSRRQTLSDISHLTWRSSTPGWPQQWQVWLSLLFACLSWCV